MQEPRAFKQKEGLFTSKDGSEKVSWLIKTVNDAKFWTNETQRKIDVMIWNCLTVL